MRANTHVTLVIDNTAPQTQRSKCATPPQSFLTDQHPSPDSTFAAGKLIDQRELCLGVDGEVISPIKVTLESDGGYLEDDYKLGKVFRDRGVTTIMPDNKMAPLIKG
jgi:hypothetical protein